MHISEVIKCCHLSFVQDNSLVSAVPADNKTTCLFTAMLITHFGCINIFWIKVDDFPKILDSLLAIE